MLSKSNIEKRFIDSIMASRGLEEDEIEYSVADLKERWNFSSKK